MTDTETQRIEEIFLDALDLKLPEERRVFLDNACAGSPARRQAVEERLASQPAVDRFFGEIHFEMAPAAEDLRSLAGEKLLGLETVEDDFTGTRIGNYKLLQRIGEGGCGVVYMADQVTPVQRRVALKIIKLGMDTKNVIARFEAERQALAMMDHPHIARVLDAGATETGRPYFVMELVRGVKITTYCDDNEFDARQRLELFIPVCHAIQHAHQKGVIHRDIKPSNILVTLHDGVPVPKVIDFGIAKATEGKLTDNTLFTAYDQFIGTPAYMSPEQAEMSGLDVDTRSDIYSLGVLLYELLTSRTPFDQKQLISSGLDGMRRTLREKEPQRPSSMVTSLRNTELTATAKHRHVEPPKLISILKGDLDWVVMKALEKDRRRRYDTANGLAADVLRYMNHEPVVARPPSRVYRLQKLVQRNKLVFAAGTVAVLGLAVGFGTSTWMFFREREARHRAVAAEQQQGRLRMEAENREKVTLAAFQISRGDYAAADGLVAGLSGINPSLEAESVLRDLGEWHALQNKWDRAAACFHQLLQADQWDKSEMITSDLLMAGPIQIERGDMPGYDHFRRAAMARFAGTTNAIDAERTLKISLLLPASNEVMRLLEPFDGVAAGSFEKQGVNGGTNPLMAAWRCVSLALMAYRQGYTPTAKEWCRKSQGYQVNTPARIATVHVIRAMACYQLQELDASRSELEQGRQMIENQFIGGLKRGNGSEGWWYDWLFARVLLHEAEGLIEPAVPSNNKTNRQPS